MSRGNAREAIFLDDVDRQRFLSTLHRTVERANVLCHAYCLMGNHYHLLLETPEANLSATIHYLNGVYSQGFNRRHERVGHLFQGRFESKLIEEDSHLVVVARYIDLNPVRSDLVPNPSDWPWSSYRARIGLSEAPSFLSVDSILTRFSKTDRHQAQIAYRRFVESGSADTTPPSDGRPFAGSEAFATRLSKLIAESAPLKEIPRVHRFSARPTLETLFVGFRDRRDRNTRIRKAHLDHGYTMTQIAAHLGLHLMTISRAVRSNVEM